MKNMILVAALLFSSIGNAASWVSPIDVKYKNKSPELFELLVEARGLLDRHRGKREILWLAKEKLDSIILEDDRYAPAYREYGRLMMKFGHISSGDFMTGSLSSSESAILASIEIEPGYADSYVLLGHLYTKKGDYEKAEDSLQRAGDIGTELPWFHLNYADLLRETGRVDQTLYHYMSVVDSDTDNRNAYSSALAGVAYYYRDKNNLTEAETWFKRSAEFDNSAWKWGAYSRFMTYWVGDFDKGIEAGEKAISIMSYGLGRLHLACAYYGKWYQIKDSFPEQAEAYYMKASAIKVDKDRVISKLITYGPTQGAGLELSKKTRYEKQ